MHVQVTFAHVPPDKMQFLVTAAPPSRIIASELKSADLTDKTAAIITVCNGSLATAEVVGRHDVASAQKVRQELSKFESGKRCRSSAIPLLQTVATASTLGASVLSHIMIRTHRAGQAGRDALSLL